MSARDVIADELPASNRNIALYNANIIIGALRVMPEPDRLALARELAGPGYAVVPVAEADALLAEVGRLREALEALLDVQDYATGWDNGVTDSTGTINEGAHFHALAMDRARAAIAAWNRRAGEDKP